MEIPILSKNTSRQLAIKAQLLPFQGSICDSTTIYPIIRQLGYVQIDTISVVNRAHHQTLWARCNSYNESQLDQLQARERKIYEYWAHAMAYLPMEDFRYSLPRMKNFQNPNSRWAKHSLEKCRYIINDVYKRIEEEGPLGSKDFKNGDGKKSGEWWDWKPAKLALELLYWQGKLMVSERNKFQKKYDLTERVLPDGIDLTFPDTNEMARFVISGALKSMGLANKKEIMKFMQPSASRDSDLMLVSKKEIEQCLLEMIEEKEIKKVGIEGIEGYYYMLSDNKTSKIINELPIVRFLSPFDNLIIQRERTKQLFDYDYSLECYVPEPKRKYGYFVFSILFGDKLVGRFDPKADRKNKIFILKNLYFENGFECNDHFIHLFVQQLVKFAAFHNCETISVEKCADKKVLAKIRSELKKQF